MLDAVLLVLREVLEAALFLSLLFALSSKLGLRWHWGVVAVGAGLLGSGLLSMFAYPIAEAWDGVGQELLNVALYLIAMLSFTALIAHLAPLVFGRRQPVAAAASTRLNSTWIQVLSTLVVACSMAREGSEVWIYLSAFSADWDALAAAGMGGVVGAGIGISLGALVYYTFVFTPDRHFFPLFVGLSTFVVGGLSMQAARQLMQIGWLDSGRPVWDSSWLVSERSWLGELFRALFGYDANPDSTQALCYAGSLLVIALVVGVRLARRRSASNA